MSMYKKGDVLKAKINGVTIKILEVTEKQYKWEELKFHGIFHTDRKTFEKCELERIG